MSPHQLRYTRVEHPPAFVTVEFSWRPPWVPIIGRLSLNLGLVPMLGSSWRIKSYGRICSTGLSLVAVITCMHKKINEEFTGEMNGKLFKIGVCEIEEDWYPFKPFSTCRYVESEDDDDGEEMGDDEDDDVDEEEEENDVEQDGISDTVEMINDGLEDGEIPPVDPPGEAPMTDAVHEELMVGESEEPPVNNYLGTPSVDVNAGYLPTARDLEDTALRGGRSLDKNPDLNIWAGPNSEFIPNVPLHIVDPSPQMEENANSGTIQSLWWTDKSIFFPPRSIDTRP
ncbi:hypothetical protein L2E82_11693 [Cichorium intybus]|uniref:Uncharacterized protein n=1 Tax=Cichorium intybus TaxID=13427 RepID=A0ACB9GDV9_CICIN|nr:hypothetical protein L2E82_11693 [Cichorium intybus]